MPIHNRDSTLGHVAERLEAQLPGVGRPVGKALGLCLKQQIVIVPEAPAQAAAEPNLLACESVLTGVVDVTPSDIQAPGGGLMVYLWLDAIGVAYPAIIKIVGQKLSGLGVFPHNIRLPRQKLIHQPPLEPGELRRVTAVDGSGYSNS